MKFLCENCKAKYQISDEKIAGRTVRMKCRKCGHLIEVQASVTETSVASRAPTDRPHPAAPLADAAVAERDRIKGPRLGTPLPPPPPRGARSSSVPPPPKPAKPARPAGSLGAGSVGAGSVAAGAVGPARPAGQPDHALPGAGLSTAFSKAVAAPPKVGQSSVSAAMEVLSSSSSEEWYVGINGVPVGPVRLSELRRKAAAGLVTGESLVWREGFEEWVPLRTFPELSAILQEAAASGRTSLTPAPGPVATASPWSVAPPAAGARPPSRTPPPRPPGPAASRNNVVPITSRLATAEKLDVAAVIVNDGLLDAPPRMATPPSASAAPAAAQLAAGVLETTGPSDSSVSVRSPRKRRVHPAAWGVVGLFGVLIGMGSMSFLATRKPAPVQIVTVTVPAGPTAAPTATGEGEGITTIGPIEVAVAPAAKSGGSTASAGGAATKGAGDVKPSGAAPATPANPSLSGLSGLVGGPSAGPNAGSTTGGGGSALVTADVERVVQSHRAFVKRQCWEPALSAKTPNAPSSARVVASITIAGDGHVQGASASGGDTYPGLANCVQNQVKSWKFPPSDGASVSVPFVFAAQ